MQNQGELSFLASKKIKKAFSMDYQAGQPSLVNKLVNIENSK